MKKVLLGTALLMAALTVMISVNQIKTAETVPIGGVQARLIAETMPIGGFSVRVEI